MTDQDPTQRVDLQSTEEPSLTGPLSPAPPIPTQPVTTAPSGRTGRSRVKWLAALVVTALVVGTAAGATLLLTGSSGNPSVLAWTPADSVIYAELRLDLPGSQQAELAKVMRAFPGFADQAAFPTKLREALDQLVNRASGGKQGYLADIEPWFGGQLAVSVGPMPATADAKAARVLLMAGVKDAGKASAWATKLLADVGGTVATETYNGVTITTVTPTASGDVVSGVTGAWAITGPVLAIGDTASVKAAIDTRGTAGLATNAQFKTASESVSGDRLGFAYVDAAAVAKGAGALAGAVPSAMPQLPAALGNIAPSWLAATVRASNGSFVVETRMPHISTLGPAKAAESKLPSVLPATTVALVEGHDIGQALEQLKTLAAADPQLADGVKQVDDALMLVGGYGAIVDWMGETGIAVTRTGDTLAGGLVVAPTDKAAVDRLLTQLRAFVELAGGSTGIKVTDEAYGNATITVVDLGNLGALAGAATGGAVSGLPPNITIAYAVTDQVVVLGSGVDFVKSVLDARTGDSLAKSSRFTAALAQVDQAHGSLLWLDVAGARSLLEAQIPAADRAAYEANAKPYLNAFDAVIGTFTPGDTLDRGTLIIRVTGQ